jgi:hypothetical protein
VPFFLIIVGPNIGEVLTREYIVPAKIATVQERKLQLAYTTALQQVRLLASRNLHRLIGAMVLVATLNGHPKEAEVAMVAGLLPRQYLNFLQGIVG